MSLTSRSVFPTRLRCRRHLQSPGQRKPLAPRRRVRRRLARRLLRQASSEPGPAWANRWQLPRAQRLRLLLPQPPRASLRGALEVPLRLCAAAARKG